MLNSLWYSIMFFKLSKLLFNCVRNKFVELQSLVFVNQSLVSLSNEMSKFGYNKVDKKCMQISVMLTN